jgi:hypothetical protein
MEDEISYNVIGAAIEVHKTFGREYMFTGYASSV